MMRNIAELIMKGRMQAGLLALLGTCVPMFFWFSAAVVALVILRQGLNRGIEVLLWALIPAGYWAMEGNPSALFTLLSCVVLATCLRKTVSWSTTLVLALVVGGIEALIVQSIMPEAIAALSEMANNMIKEQLLVASAEVVVEQALLDQLSLLIPFIMVGVISWLYQLFAVGGLLLARYWQSMLYNPGGFGTEMNALRLPTLWAVLLLALIVLGAQLSPWLAILVPIASIPLFVAGVTLVHSQVKRRKMSKSWLYGLYLLLLLATQIIYPLLVLLAFLDSVFDFRAKKSKNQV